MDSLKENKERKNQRENTRENQQTHRLSPDSFVDKIVRNSTAWKRGITRKMLAEAATIIGMTADEVNAWQRYMDEAGWTFKDGTLLNWRNYRRPLRMWHHVETNRKASLLRREAAIRAMVTRNVNAETLARKAAELAVKAKQDAAMWVLCNERCANANGCGCKRGVRIPPDKQLPRPCQPEECPHYEAKED